MEHPVPPPLFTVTIYIPAAAPVVGLTLAFAVNAPLVIATGPVHEYPATFAAPFAERFNAAPAHTGLLLEAPVSDGALRTVIGIGSVAFALVHPMPA